MNKISTCPLYFWGTLYVGFWEKRCFCGQEEDHIILFTTSIYIIVNIYISSCNGNEQELFLMHGKVGMTM